MRITDTSRLIVLVISVFILAACGGREEPTPTAAPPTEVAEPQLVGDAEEGKALFSTTCAACHGPTGEGVEGLGKDMTHSEFIAEKSDAELLDFLHTGRDASDPLNTTGVLMPPKGGNPALTDQQLMDIIAYVREIHQ